MQLSIATNSLIPSVLSSESSQPELTFGFERFLPHIKTIKHTPLLSSARVGGTVLLSLLLWIVTLHSVAAATTEVASAAVTQRAGSAKPHDIEAQLATVGAGTGAQNPVPAPLIYAASNPAATAPLYAVTLIFQNPNYELDHLTINNVGQVTGDYIGTGRGGGLDGYHGFVWSAGKPMVMLLNNDDPVSGEKPNAINDSGHIAGYLYNLVSNPIITAAIWNASDGSYVKLDPTEVSNAVAINSEGYAAGTIDYFGTVDYNGAVWSPTGTLLPIGFPTEFNGINDSLQLCATTDPYSYAYNLLTNASELLSVPGSIGFHACGINASGTIAGSVYSPTVSSDIAGYFDPSGVFHQIGLADASGINDPGQIVGVDDTGKPYVWSASTGISELQQLIPNTANWTLQTADAVNNSGQIVGLGQYNGAQAMYVLTPAISETAFTLSPNQLSAAGPNVTATVTTTGPVTGVTVTCAPGTLFGVVAPTFTLTPNGNTWTGTIPTTFLKSAYNPATFIATATSGAGATATSTATLQVGPLPSLSLSLNSDTTFIHRSQTFNLVGSVRNVALETAGNATVTVTLPAGVTYVSSNGGTVSSSGSVITLNAGTLAPSGGIYPISIMLQAASTAPLNTPLSLVCTATCANFQPAADTVKVSIDPGLVPLGVAVISTKGFGILDGSASVDFADGNAPLHATVTPYTSLTNIFDLFGNDHRATVYLDVTASANGQATVGPGGSGISYFLAQNNLMTPSVSPSYVATFATINDSVTTTVSFTGRDFVLTAIDALIEYIATAYNAPVPTVDSIFSVFSDTSQLSTFVTVEKIISSSHPKNTAQFIQEIANASKDMLSLTGPERTAFLGTLKNHGIITDEDVADIGNMQTCLAAVFNANTLLHTAADSLTIAIVTGGNPMAVSYDAVPFTVQGN